MKMKLSTFVVCSVLMLAALSGCANYASVSNALDDITVQNTLPIVEEDASYNYLDDIDELVYEQQINACSMYIDTYNQTYYKQFQNGDFNSSRLAKLCTEKRNEIFIDIEIAFDINLYRLLRDVRDCTNRDAYVFKTHEDVRDFFDIYGEYENGDNPDDALVAILLEYAERSNILALKFLEEHDTEVFEAAAAKIEENAAMTDEVVRVSVNSNNLIIKALNTVYGGVPDEYMDSITESSNVLAKKFIMSMDKITEEERDMLLAKLDGEEMLSTTMPTASVMPTDVPMSTPMATPVPTAVPKTPTPRPLATAIPSTPRPTAAPTQRPVATPTPYEPIFGIDDDGNNTEGGMMFQ